MAGVAPISFDERGRSLEVTLLARRSCCGSAPDRGGAPDSTGAGGHAEADAGGGNMSGVIGSVGPLRPPEGWPVSTKTRRGVPRGVMRGSPAVATGAPQVRQNRSSGLRPAPHA